MTDVAPPVEEGTQVVSYSELDTYRQCPLKHQLSYVFRFSKEPEEGSPLRKGTLWHLVMEAHYLVIQKWQTLSGTQNPKPVPLKSINQVLAQCRAAAAVFWADDHGNQTEDQELIEWMYDGYVEQHGIDRDWLILGVEQRKQWHLPNEGGEPSPYVIKAKLDVVIMLSSNHTIWVVDHKSGANLPSQMDLEIDDQFGLYVWFLKQEGLNVVGAIHNAARTTRNQADFDGYVGKSKPQTLEQRMHRTYLNRTDIELNNIAMDAFNVAVNMYPELTGRTRLPLYSAPDPRQCGWKCDFKEVHLMARTGINIEEALEGQGFKQNFERH